MIWKVLQGVGKELYKLTTPILFSSPPIITQAHTHSLQLPFPLVSPSTLTHVRYIMYYTLAALTTFASSAAAIGNAVVLNKCSNTIYAWSVGSSVGAKQTIATGKNFTEPLHSDATSGGIALKITAVDDGLYNGAAQQIFSYSLDGASVWYDLSTAFGEPFLGKRVTVTSSGSPSIEWPTGSNPGGSQVKVGINGVDVVFTGCA
ncbi:hypothetical protein PMIN02_008114 [Paraphaeosphaeria minitans]